ncbi:hypothetical protein Vadar_010935 [Vaccinium darrowii]|uniref:Uncharacterized protein n=1 Tax=Vaccinium darrowii TaxID=229202 RepID=A0ACB7YVM0_9ERIC|nr:hypothetical protein Vadar_010935 [Vaccinium darrowii]
MADKSRGRASFWTRADALLRKNLTFQKRNTKATIRLILYPYILCLILEDTALPACYIDLVIPSGSGVERSPLFFLINFRKKPLSSSSFKRPRFERQESKVVIELDKPDVAQEREKVEQLLLKPNTNHSIICFNLKKVYPRRDGNPEKFAARGMSLALPQGECFGMVGPNGAGKTSFINMAVEESLKSVNLFHGGVADKTAGTYSGAHSMEEAEHLCDRLGIFVDGSLQCIGNPKELKARYGGSYVFTMTTSSNHEEEVENLVKNLSPNANKI